MKKFNFLFFALLCSFSLNAQVQWQQSLGGSDLDIARSIIQTSDSGYVVAGYSESTNGNVTGNHGGTDYWVVKLNSSGAVEWEQSLGGTDDERAYSVIQAFDSGYVVAGFTKSNDGDVTGYHGNYDYWVVKLDASGAIEWQKSLGGTNDDEARSVIQTSDSGYVVTGFSSSNDYDVSGNHGSQDYWVVKLNSSGTIVWQKCLGGSSSDMARAIIQTSDSGYAITGYCNSNNGNVSGNHGGTDCWVVKLNSTGTIQWQQSYGGTSNEYAYSIAQTLDSGYIFSATSNSNNGNVSGNHGSYDYWVVKLNASGTLQWQKSLGGIDYEEACSVVQSLDNGYAVAGHSLSNNGDVTGNHGGYDYWLVKLDTGGTIEWQQCLGGIGNEYAYCMSKSLDNQYLVAGSTTSNNGVEDYWILKYVSSAGLESLAAPGALHFYPNPSSNIFSVRSNPEFNNAQLQIFNTQCESVYSCPLNGETKVIDIEKFSPGLYYLQITNGQKIWTAKIIKQ